MSVEQQRERRKQALGYDPEYRPSLSARRTLARMYRGQEYTPVQMAEFSQSSEPSEIVKQLRARGYVTASYSTVYRWYSLTSSGHSLAVRLRESGEYPIPPPKPALTPALPSDKPRQEPTKRKIQRTNWGRFRLGGDPTSYLTDPQKALLLKIADCWGGIPRKHTVGVLIRCGLVQTDGQFLTVTESGAAAAKKLRST